MLDGFDLSQADLKSFVTVIATILVMNSGKIFDLAATAIKSHYEGKAARRESFRQIGMLLKRVYALEEQQTEREKMKSFAAHYSNKYPNGHVDYDESKLTAYDRYGRKRVAIAVGGNGEIVDRSAEVGALDKHCLAPIPKNSRAFKLYPNGKLGPAEEYQERIQVGAAIAVQGKVLSLEEYKAHQGFVVSGDSVTVKVVEAPAPQAPATPQEPPVGGDGQSQDQNQIQS